MYFKCRIESAHWVLKRLLQNSLGDLCCVWEAMNNMIILQHTAIKASFETSTYVIEHVFKSYLIQDMNNMITLQHTAIKISFETSTYVIGHVFKRNRWPNIKDQRSVIHLTMSMWMHCILCKIIIFQWNGLHHHANNQNHKGICLCWINFIHAFMISLKILLMSNLMVVVNIV